jgi:hypothetical protein
LSLHALSGQPQHRAIQLSALVKNQVLVVPIDSGSSHTFLNSVLAQKLQATTTPLPPMSVKVANGASLSCTAEVKNFKLWVQGYTFQVDAKLIDIGAYDLVLGMEWLERFSPMTCDWLAKWIEFSYQGEIIRLQGMLPSEPQMQLQEVSVEQVLKWHRGNDLWATVLLFTADTDLDCTETYLKNGIPSKIKDLIQEYGTIFEEPTKLPPSRLYDHSITLLPNAAPVNCRPYQYSPEQKDEIERQVTKMLESGVVVPSISPFASHVLLVKKKDNTQRFFVDYRKLNNISVKNIFSLPIIDEFLDEIAGAQYFSTIDLASGFHQIRMVPTDESRTAFKTHHGHF